MKTSWRILKRETAHRMRGAIERDRIPAKRIVALPIAPPRYMHDA